MGRHAARDGGSSKTLDHQSILLTTQKLGILITLQSASKKGRKRHSGLMKTCTDLSIICEQITCTGIPFHITNSQHGQNRTVFKVINIACKSEKQNGKQLHMEDKDTPL